MEDENIFACLDSPQEDPTSLPSIDAHAAAHVHQQPLDNTITQEEDARDDPFLQKLIRQIQEAKTPGSGVAPYVEFRVSNAKQVVLEKESTEALIGHFEGVLRSLEEMIKR
ncbi:hypothetical protein Emed_002627 [Eimeria media]